MKFLEYGKKEDPSILLIHGTGCSGSYSFESVKQCMEEHYRVIIVALDGYDGGNNEFSTIQDQAKQIARFIEENYGGQLYGVLGMSLGGFITLELLGQYDIQVDKVILDSGYLMNMPFAKSISKLVAWGFANIGKDKHRFLIKQGMNFLMGYCFQKQDLYVTVTKQTIYNCEYSCLTYKLPENIEKLKNINIQYWFGAKEKSMIKGMQYLKQRLPNLVEVCMGEVGHGEIMFSNPKCYAELVKQAFMS